jgi:5-methylcytosine-specific restriction protein A
MRKPWHKEREHRTLTGRPWRRLREQILQRDKYLCQHCQRAGRVREATEVDHKTPLSKGGTDKPENLQSLCSSCHEAKTMHDQGVKAKVAVGVDGWPA